MTSAALTIVVTVHLLAVYLAMMGPAVALWLQWRSAGDDLAARLDRFYLWLAAGSLLIASALGGLAVLLIARLFPDAYLSAVRELPLSRYWPYGAIELVFSLGCFAFALLLPGVGGRSRLRFWSRWLATLLGGTNLVYHFPPLFVMLGVLATRPRTWGQQVRFTALLADPEVLARVTHHVFAALAIAGLAAIWYSWQPGDDNRRSIAWGGRIAASALVLQFLSGAWLVAVMPVESRQMLLGGDALTLLLFCTALVVSFFVLPRLAAMAFGETERRHALVTLWLVVAIVLLMTATRQRTRERFIIEQAAAQSDR